MCGQIIIICLSVKHFRSLIDSSGFEFLQPSWDDETSEGEDEASFVVIPRLN